MWRRASLPGLFLLLVLVQTSVVGSQSGWLEADFFVLARAAPGTYPGTETVILNNLTNRGLETLRITESIYRTYTTQRPYSWDYHVPGLPLNLSSGENRILNVTANIQGVPGGRITAIIQFQYWNSTSYQWITPAESPLVINKTLPLQQAPIEQAIRRFLNVLPIIIAIWWATVVAVLLIFFRYEQRKRGKTRQTLSSGNSDLMNPKEIVKRGFNEIASEYMAARAKDSEDVRLLKELVDRLPKGAKVLDAGCGSGVPVTRYLARFFDVTGVDFSETQIKLAHRLVPKAKLICEDITDLAFPDESFDAICSYYAIFHVPAPNIEEFYRTFLEC